jgi:hypothetical protein
MKPSAMIVFAGLITIVSGVARAQAPARNGNVWDGKSHQPSAGAVRSNEHAAGIAPPQPQQQNENEFVEKQAKALVDKTHREVGQSPRPH